MSEKSKQPKFPPQLRSANKILTKSIPTDRHKECFDCIVKTVIRWFRIRYLMENNAATVFGWQYEVVPKVKIN